MNSVSFGVKILAIIVGVVSVLTIFGWILDIDVLRAVVPGTIGMKISTASLLFISALNLYFLETHNPKRRYLGTQLLLCSLVFLAILLILVAGPFGHYPLPDKFSQFDFSNEEAIPGLKIIGIPSMGTLLGLIFFNLGILCTTYRLHFRAITRLLGILTLSIGLIALLGYALEAPLLTFYFPFWKTPVAVNTSFCLLLLGFGLVMHESENS